MAQLQRVEGQTKLKCKADKFFDVWTRKTSLVPKLCPQKYTKIELNEGDSWDKLGAVTTWTYYDIGGCETVKTRVEEIDEENGFVKYSYFEEGFIMEKYYKTLKSMIQATPDSEGKGCIVTWSFEYEKMNDDAPSPSIYVDWLLGAAKDMDACLCN